MTTQPSRGVRIRHPLGVEEEMPHPTAARLAIEVLYHLLVTALPSQLGPAGNALGSILDTLHATLWLREKEHAEETGQFAHYLIIRPINPLNLPSPGETKAIAQAIATLDRNNLLARPWSDEGS